MSRNQNRFTTTVRKVYPFITVIITHGILESGRRIPEPEKLEIYWNYIKHQANYLLSKLKNCEIILMANSQVSKYFQGKKDRNFRMIEHSLYEFMGESDQVRHALLNRTYDKVLICRDNGYIKSNPKMEDSFVGYTKNYYKIDPGLVIVNDKVKQISFGIPNTFMDCVYLQDKELELMQKFCSEKSNSKYLLFECINSVIENGGNFLAQELESGKFHESINQFR